MNRLLQVVFILIICISIFFRFYNLWQNAEFDWDQEYLSAFPAKHILEGDYTLIGAKTSTGDLYIGPLYSYISALFYLIFGMNPISGFLLAGTLSTVTLLLSSYLLFRIYNIRVALYYAVFWAVSPFLIPWERTPWNVNLLSLSSILIISGLLMITQKKKKSAGIILGIGFFLGVNSHLTFLFLFGGAMMYLLLQKKYIDISTLIALGCLAIALIPLVLFDFRNNHLLVHNALGLFSSSTSEDVSFFQRGYFIFGDMLEIIGRSLVFPFSQFAKIIGGLYIILTLFFLKRKSKYPSFLQLFFSFFIIYIIGFTLYKGATPFYYYIGIIPVFFLGLALLLERLETKIPYLAVGVLCLSLVNLYYTSSFVREVKPNSIYAKEKIVEAIATQSSSTTISYNLDTDPGRGFGYEYLVELFGLKKSDKADLGNMYWISYPAERFPGQPDVVYGNIALGFPQTSQNIYSTKEAELFSSKVKVRIPKDWNIASCEEHYRISLKDEGCSVTMPSQHTIFISQNEGCLFKNLSKQYVRTVKGDRQIYVVQQRNPDVPDFNETIAILPIDSNSCLIFKESLKSTNLSEPLIKVIEHTKIKKDQQ